MGFDDAIKLAGYVVAGFGAYMAIRVDLKGIQVDISNMKEHLVRHENWLQKL